MADDNFAKDLAFSETFMAPMMKIIRAVPEPRDMRLATPFEDKKRASDIFVVKRAVTSKTCSGEIAVACRIRRADYRHWPYLNEFTIRSARPPDRNGDVVLTEKDKIFDGGYCDWMFYGFEKPPAKDDLPGTLIINPWIVIDLHQLRDVKKDVAAWQRCYGGEKTLKNGCKFWPININALPPACILERQLPHEQTAGQGQKLAPSAPTRAELKAEHERKTKDLFECLGAKRAKA